MRDYRGVYIVCSDYAFNQTRFESMASGSGQGTDPRIHKAEERPNSPIHLDVLQNLDQLRDPLRTS